MPNKFTYFHSYNKLKHPHGTRFHSQLLLCTKPNKSIISMLLKISMLIKKISMLIKNKYAFENKSIINISS